MGRTRPAVGHQEGFGDSNQLSPLIFTPCPPPTHPLVTGVLTASREMLPDTGQPVLTREPWWLTEPRGLGQGGRRPAPGPRAPLTRGVTSAELLSRLRRMPAHRPNWCK